MRVHPLPWPRAYLSVGCIRASIMSRRSSLARTSQSFSVVPIGSLLLSPTVRRDRAFECDMATTKSLCLHRLVATRPADTQSDALKSVAVSTRLWLDGGQERGRSPLPVHRFGVCYHLPRHGPDRKVIRHPAWCTTPEWNTGHRQESSPGGAAAPSASESSFPVRRAGWRWKQRHRPACLLVLP